MSKSVAVGVVVRRSCPPSARSVDVTCPSCSDVLTFRLHADMKTSPRGVNSISKGAVATYANAFHLPSGRPGDGGSCDGATSACLSVCYASAMERRFVAFKSGALQNLENLRHLAECAGSVGVRLATDSIVDHSVGFQIRDGLAPTFRWHSDGDVWIGDDRSSAMYARAIRRTSDRVGRDLGCRSWIYTRSLGRVRHLVGSDHLAVYVSTDRDNHRRAVRVAERWGALVAFMVADGDELGKIEVDRNSIKCPATAKYARDGLAPSFITAIDGRRRGIRSGDIVRGACDSCALCVEGRRDVAFLTGGHR